MTETNYIVDSRETESVYSAHHDRILEKTAVTKSLDTYIDQMKDHASEEIPNTDAATMNCSIFNDFIYTCNFIGVKERMREDRVYPALRMIGHNRCYHEYKLNRRDVFSDIHALVEKCKLSFDYDAMEFASTPSSFFNGVKTKVYRVDKRVSAIAVKRAEECGVRTADMNLYHALYGLKTLVEREPDYILLADNAIVVDSLKVLDRADKSLLLQKRFLEAVLG